MDFGMICSMSFLTFALLNFFAFIPASSRERPSPLQLHPGRNDVEFDHDGRRRTAVIFIPNTGQVPANGWSLVMMLHGAGGSAKNVIESTGWAELGDNERFVTIFPNGTPRNEKRAERFVGNPQTWNSGGKQSLAAGESSATAKNIDDVGFLGALLDRVRREMKIDPRGIYIAGHSNGAGMAYRFAFERSDIVAAVGVVAGHFFLEPKPLTHPVSLIQIVGDKDPFTPMSGGDVSIAGRTATLPPALQGPSSWATMLGLGPEPTVAQDDEKLRIQKWGPSKNGAEVRSIIIKGHGHAYPSPMDKFHPSLLFGPTVRKLNATERMWEFFREHPKV
jgi:polyhydroxybutyrate depolymerase